MSADVQLVLEGPRAHLTGPGLRPNAAELAGLDECWNCGSFVEIPPSQSGLTTDAIVRCTHCARSAEFATWRRFGGRGAL